MNKLFCLWLEFCDLHDDEFGASVTLVSGTPAGNRLCPACLLFESFLFFLCIKGWILDEYRRISSYLPMFFDSTTLVRRTQVNGPIQWASKRSAAARLGFMVVFSQVVSS